MGKGYGHSSYNRKYKRKYIQYFMHKRNANYNYNNIPFLPISLTNIKLDNTCVHQGVVKQALLHINIADET